MHALPLPELYFSCVPAACSKCHLSLDRPADCRLEWLLAPAAAAAILSTGASVPGGSPGGGGAIDWTFSFAPRDVFLTWALVAGGDYAGGVDGVGEKRAAGALRALAGLVAKRAAAVAAELALVGAAAAGAGALVPDSEWPLLTALKVNLHLKDFYGTMRLIKYTYI